MNKYVKYAFKGIGGAILFAGLLFLFGWVVSLLWNALMPDIFGLPEIGYWQAMGILVLSKIIFGFNMGRESKSRKRHHRHKRTWDSEEECCKHFKEHEAGENEEKRENSEEGGKTALKDEGS